MYGLLNCILVTARFSPTRLSLFRSGAALSAMMMTYPLDTLKSRVQAGISASAATQMRSWSSGLPWAVGKCLLANFVALTMYEAVRKSATALKDQYADRSKSKAKIQKVAACQSSKTR